jgi:hypothetical protein
MDWWFYLLELLDEIDADPAIGIVGFVAVIVMSGCLIITLLGLVVRLYKAAR